MVWNRFWFGLTRLDSVWFVFFPRLVFICCHAPYVESDVHAAPSKLGNWLRCLVHGCYGVYVLSLLTFSIALSTLVTICFRLCVNCYYNPKIIDHFYETFAKSKDICDDYDYFVNTKSSYWPLKIRKRTVWPDICSSFNIRYLVGYQ